MNGAGFILAINLFIAGLLATAFMTIAAYDRKQQAARWFGLSYLIGMAYVAIEFCIPFFYEAKTIVVLAFAVFLAATIMFNFGLARKYGRPFPAWSAAAFFCVATFAVFLVQDLPRQSFVRMSAYQLPYAAMQFLALWAVVRTKNKRATLDFVLIGLLAASALQFASKPLLAHAFGGWGANPQAYVDSTYAMVSQSMGLVFALAIALTFLVILGRDIVADVTTMSMTDTLSGLLNRGGFEQGAAVAVQDARRLGVPVSLVIADLDHFKLVNDTFGHASGDIVIRTFADFLRSAMAGRHVAGRIGGEEFAILLPGTNLAAARLFAEGARSAFATLEIRGMPKGRRFTASFGVAELAGGEGVSELMIRADRALYAAKDSGRDCVRIAPRPDMRRSGDGYGAAIRMH